MDFSRAPEPVQRDAQRFTLADYDYESDASGSRVARGPLAADFCGQHGQRIRATVDPLSNSDMAHQSAYRGDLLSPWFTPNLTHSVSASASGSRSARPQPPKDTQGALPRSFTSATSFSKHLAPVSPTSELSSSRSYAQFSSYDNTAQPWPDDSNPYPQPLPSASSYVSDDTMDRRAPGYASDQLDTMPSLPRTYSSGRSLNDVAPEEDTLGRQHEPEEKLNAPLPSAKSSGPRRAVPWYKKIIPTSTPCRLLLLTILIELVVDLSIEANILYRFHAEVHSADSTQLELENKRRLPIYLIIYGLAHLWELVLTIVAIRTRNTVQVVAITAFNFAVLGYAVIQIYELRSILGDNLADSLSTEENSDSADDGSTLLSLPLNVLTAVVICVVAAGSVALVVLSYFIRREFGWDRYRFLGADLQIRKLYFRFQVFECICVFSAFFCAGFGVQFIWLVLQKTDAEYIITWVMFPLSILLLVMGRYSAKYESKWLMAPFMFGLICGCAYFVFKLIRIWQQHSTTYVNVAASLTVFDGLSLLSLAACFVGGAVVWSGFRKGLKQALLSQTQAAPLSSFTGFWRLKSGEAESEAIDLNQRRISII